MGLTANELSPSKATGGSNPLASAVADSSAAQLKNIAPVAQRIEHLTTDQKVGGSNPFGRAQVRGAFRHREGAAVGTLTTVLTTIAIAFAFTLRG